MNRPPLEVADIVRCAGQSFIERSRKWINGQHEKVLLAITRCRTAALGGHRDQCSDCGHSAISYNSCRNRHCPKCQGNARVRWLQTREQELLPTHYVHVVFTLPRELAPLALQNKRLIYNLLFHASAETLLEIARDPRHLGAQIGFFSVLHTWDQRLQHHPHVHCVLAAGGLAPDHSRWISSRRSFFLPLKVLGRVFRGKFVAGLKNAFHAGALQFHGHLLTLAESRAFASWLRVLFRQDWVVYAKLPFGGPEHVLRYLGACTHRVAISNHRLVALAEGNVTFRWRDSAHGNKKRLMTLSLEEFLRSFLLTCCRAALCASATSASSLTGGEQNFFHSVSACSRHPISQQLQLPRPPRRPFARCGNVRSAAEPCVLSSTSRLRNSSSDLRLISAGAQHESTTPTSNLARVSARTLVLCLTFLRMQYGCAIQTLRPAASPPLSLRPPTETEAHRQQGPPRTRQRPTHRDTNPIVLQAASFKSLYLKRPYTAHRNGRSSLVGASDTALRLVGSYEQVYSVRHPQVYVGPMRRNLDCVR
jgi:Putative transposase/Transposase zinc-binding domain